MVLEHVRVEVGEAPEAARGLHGDTREQDRRDAERGTRDDAHVRCGRDGAELAADGLVAGPARGARDQHPGARRGGHARVAHEGVGVAELERHVHRAQGA